MHDVYMWSNSEPHVELSLQYYLRGKDTSDFTPNTFVGPALRLDCRGKQVNQTITIDDFKMAGEVQIGDRVILWQGRDHQYRTKQSHDRPYVTAEAAEWLALDRKIKLLGTDSSGFEVRGASNHPNHHLFFKAGVDIPVVECLRNLGAIPTPRFFFIGAPIPCRGLDASPIRALALVGEAFGK